MSAIRAGNTLIKTISFAAVHFSVAFSVAYLLTGSIAIASALALVEPLANTVAYYFHERLWQRLGERTPAAAGAPIERRCAGVVSRAWSDSARIA